MVKDALNSFFDNIKERTTNPFLGTFVIVWLIHNAKLVYIILFFDKGLPLNSKLQIINNYFTVNPFIWHTILVVIITMLVLIFTYLMLAIARLVTDFFERIVTPSVSKWTDKNSIVLKSDYIELQTKLIDFEQRLKDERALRIVSEKERDSAELQIIEDKGIDVIPELNDSDKRFNRISKSLSNATSIEEVNELIFLINSEQPIRKSSALLPILVRESILKAIDVDYGSQLIGYNFTPFGNEFVQYWNDNYADNI